MRNSGIQTASFDIKYGQCDRDPLKQDYMDLCTDAGFAFLWLMALKCLSFGYAWLCITHTMDNESDYFHRILNPCCFPTLFKPWSNFGLSSLNVGNRFFWLGPLTLLLWGSPFLQFWIVSGKSSLCSSDWFAPALSQYQLVLIGEPPGVLLETQLPNLWKLEIYLPAGVLANWHLKGKHSEGYILYIIYISWKFMDLNLL